MTDEFKIDVSKIVPAGWRLVDCSKEKWVDGDRFLSSIPNAEWRPDLTATCWGTFAVIRRIEVVPETMDVPITKTDSGELLFENPNTIASCFAFIAPCITGPKWAFVGFVWDDLTHPSRSYYLVGSEKTEYAKEVRFRRVYGGGE
jgi:hypothetical protein